jgi:epoxide hydrolase-like predicted phosphatase
MNKKTNIRAVIFDLGGVIQRTEDSRPREALAARLGKTRAELEKIVFNNPVAMAGEQGQATAEEVWAETGRLLNLAPDEIAAFRQEFFRGDRVDLDLIAFIQALRKSFLTAALSNTWNVELPRGLREDLQLDDTFDLTITSAQARVRKPAPEIFHLALEQLNVRPDEAVFVDDFAENVAAAAALGLHTVHFTGAEKARRELRVLLGLDELQQ